MTNETIEKIGHLIYEESCISCGDCRSCKYRVYGVECLCHKRAKAIYEQIVDPLEKENINLQWIINNKDKAMLSKEQTNIALHHKAEVLERALRYLAHDFNGQQFYIYAQSDTDEETYEKFIQRDEKEISNETV